jgi:site-specific DNA-methyltransferase (adenine-specific)
MPLQPYFNSKMVKLYVGDAIEVLASLPAESVDLIFADPPYNLSNGGITCHAGRMVSVNKGRWDKSRGTAADFAFHTQWISACKRVLRMNGSMWISGTYHSIYQCGYALQEGGWHILNDICWFKSNASPNLSCRMFTASHETLIWARKSKDTKHTFNYGLMKNGTFPDTDFIKKPGKQMRSVWVVSAPSAVEKRFGKHPTQKPEALLERVVLASSNPGDVVLDPFAGSATTGVVAARHGRSFIGIDTDHKYLQSIAIPRLEDTCRLPKEENKNRKGAKGSAVISVTRSRLKNNVL